VELWIEEELRGLDSRPRPPRRRAMVGLAIPVMAGAAVGICTPISPMWLWGAGALLLLPLFAWVRRAWSMAPLLLALFFLMAAHARQSTGSRPATSLPALLERPMEYVQFVAVATEDASPQSPRPGRVAGTVFYAHVEGLNREGIWRRVEDRIRVVLRGKMPGNRLPRYGERWRLHGIVRPAVPRRAGLFTLPENQAVVDSDRAVFLDGGRGNPLMAWCMERRRVCREILGRGLEDYPEQRGLVQSLMMGYREDLPAALRKDFSATGTVHIFAISGSHVAMVTLLIAGILRALGIPLTRWFLFMTPLIVVYTITTGAAVSAVRSCVMAVLVLLAPVLARRPDTISALAAAAIAILLVAPEQLGDLGFLLSFTAVAGLLAIPPVLDAGAVRWFRREEWQLPGEEPPTGRRLREASLFCVRYINVTLGAWIATTPLTAYFFNLFSPVALAMNLLVIPAAFVILLAGVMSLICAPLGGSLTEIFNHAAWAVSSFLTLCIQWAADIPGGHWFVRTPPAAGILIWYVTLCVVTVMARRVRGALAVGLAWLFVLAVAWGAWDAHRCRVSVLDVGEGNAVLVQAQSARMLVDAGPAFRAEDTLRRMRSEGVNRLDALILTHPDAQHIGAARGLLRKLPVDELWVPAVLWASPVMRETLQEAEKTGVPIRRLRAGEAGDWPGSMVWEILWPPEPMKMARADDASLVVRVARYGVSILLAGDAGEAQETAMREQGRSLAASVLLAGQHGDAGATSADWLEEVRPRDAILSAGPHSDGRHPDEETLARLTASGVRIWRTDQQGSIHVDLQGAPARWPDPGYRIRAVP
jgi:competence protein ComEC